METGSTVEKGLTGTTVLRHGLTEVKPKMGQLKVLKTEKDRKTADQTD